MSVPPPPYGDQPHQPPFGADKPYQPQEGTYGAPPPEGTYGAPPPEGTYGAPPPEGIYGAPPPYPGVNPYPQPGAPYGFDQYGQPLSDKSKLVAGLLQLFLGTFGIGRFYLGYTGLGVAMLLVSWITCGIWPLIDAILIFMGNVKDSDGRTLRD
ncbi:MAG: NINE protein [Mycobacterium sp.]